MAIAQSIAGVSLNLINKKADTYGGVYSVAGGNGRGRARVWGCRRRRRWGAYNAAADVGILETNQQQSPTPMLQIPVSCYQLLGIPAESEKDEIVKSVMHLRNAELEEGYTMDAVIARQNLLLDVRDKLLFEPEYAGNVKGNVQPKSSLRISWSWLPAALCLLQEVGEGKLVLEIGQKALQHNDAKPYIHDFLLSMALAECAIAKAGFEKNKISLGFEALARAQCFLRSKASLGKLALLSQIEESLEELAPACTLELLAMPHTPENAERRLGAIAALRELLKQGLDVEASCQVQDWPCFLVQALSKLMAVEIVELLHWDSLATLRKNKKSLESQNQRVVIDFNCFYMILIGHIALGFSTRKMDVINKAKTICECLIASEGIDMKFEEAFCLFLLGQGDEATTVEKLRQVEHNSGPASRKLSQERELKDFQSENKTLETWLKESVLDLFLDTRDCSPSLVNFFRSQKQASVDRRDKKGPQAVSSMRHRPLAPSHAFDKKGDDKSISGMDTSRHLGLAVKQLSPPNLQGALIGTTENTGSSATSPSIKLERNLGARHNKILEVWLIPSNMIGKMIYVTSLGCILFACFRLMDMRLGGMDNAIKLNFKRSNPATTSLLHTASSLSHCIKPANVKGNRLASGLEKFLPTFKLDTETINSQRSSDLSGVSSSSLQTYKMPMPVEEAEALVNKWQAIKAESLGSSHHVHGLFDVLDESMLDQWLALADLAKDRTCFWRFVLLQLSVLEANILTDETGKEVAEIVAFLEEAAELVAVSQLKNPNYYSSYKIRYVLKKQSDGSWRFCEADILSNP
ncbi:hypothetical protein LIER_19944 [Lithospermum erythrorhizon]|uniref:Plastid division protein CDP1, chloroplastic n=1 Tax=Lithospermum erythrorhizon TaxID=34254 RepID=A0AAV3QLZ2_LITER